MSVASILLVDPDQSFGKSLQSDLISQDYDVGCAVGSDQAMDFLLEKTPDLVILDETVKGLSPTA